MLWIHTQWSGLMRAIRLGPNAKRILSNPDSELIFPITALAETLDYQTR